MGSSQDFRNKIANSLKKPSEENIMIRFWEYMDGLRLSNNQSIELSQAIKYISSIFNQEISETNIEKIIVEKLKTEKYIYRIRNEGENSKDVEESFRIQLSLNKHELAQRNFQEENTQKAKETLRKFIEKTKSYADGLEKKRIPVTEETLRQQFGEMLDNEKYKTWITLAIDNVLRSLGQDR